MRYYGYDTLIHNVDSVISDTEVEEAETLFKHYRRAHYNEQTAKTFKFLHHINEKTQKFTQFFYPYGVIFNKKLFSRRIFEINIEDLM
jgi:hypothetical protein